MALIRTPKQAIAAIESAAFQRINIGVGECQKNAHEIYNIVTDGTPTAAEAWAKAKFRHTMKVSPTVGSFVYWTGGSSGAGHVAIYAGRGGLLGREHYVWSPGAPSDNDHWVKVRLKTIPAGWPGHVLAGWTEDIDGVRVQGLAPKGTH